MEDESWAERDGLREREAYNQRWAERRGPCACSGLEERVSSRAKSRGREGRPSRQAQEKHGEAARENALTLTLPLLQLKSEQDSKPRAIFLPEVECTPAEVFSSDYEKAAHDAEVHLSLVLSVCPV